MRRFLELCLNLVQIVRSTWVLVRLLCALNERVKVVVGVWAQGGGTVVGIAVGVEELGSDVVEVDCCQLFGEGTLGDGEEDEVFIAIVAGFVRLGK